MCYPLLTDVEHGAFRRRVVLIFIAQAMKVQDDNITADYTASFHPPNDLR